jgi:hypothetical protein
MLRSVYCHFKLSKDDGFHNKPFISSETFFLPLRSNRNAEYYNIFDLSNSCSSNSFKISGPMNSRVTRSNNMRSNRLFLIKVQCFFTIIKYLIFYIASTLQIERHNLVISRLSSTKRTFICRDLF